ncbi:DNA primase [Metamycoplasma gateae]|uniref:DNA primase n=1 Tax=Metamycoplasma gateae TaxID=35769 RepID=A0ABZ2AHF0_9BACT|nr:DNA primase [Metamycoplasma gateae]
MIKDNLNVWEFVISKNDIVSIIGEYVSLTKQGKNYKACCPFHGEKTPSFVVSQDKGIFKCFGCGKSGNVIKFIELKENINSIEALKFLANKQNLDLNQFSHFFDKNKVSDEQLRILEINNEANNFFRYQLLFEKTEQLKNYLKSRGIDDSLIKEFQIGFASNQKSIFNSLIEKQFNLFEISNSSLVTGQNNKNFFNDRLMFPIHNSNGDVVAFSGRDITNNQIPKYLNSSETIVFKKNKVMFNYFHAKNEIIEKNEVYLVEGQFDCIALFKAGIKNCVAIMGTSLSVDHIKEFQNKTINLFFDNDRAGINATFKNLKIILYYSKKYNLKVNFVENKINKDPDEIYQIDQGKTLNDLCKNKINIVDFIFRILNDISLNQKNSINKNEKYKLIFEYIYHLENSLILMLKEKAINNNIITADLFDYYIKNTNDIFASDLSFKSKILNEDKSQNKNRFENIVNNNEEELNNFYLDNLEKNNQNLLKLNKKTLKSKKNNQIEDEISPNYVFLKDILILCLSQSVFLNQWKNKIFHQLELKDKKQKIIRKIISYIVNKKTLGIEINKQNLRNLLEQDILFLKNSNKESLRIEYQSYLDFLDEILEKNISEKLSNSTYEFIYERIDEFVDQIHKLNKGKKILTLNKGEKYGK